MDSSSGNSDWSSSLIDKSGSGEDVQQLMEQRKRKRMQSNRESARRSRMRKQKHLDDLVAQIAQLSEDSSQILRSISLTSQHLVYIQAQNSVLMAQKVELSQRLDSLNDILGLINSSAAGPGGGHNNQVIGANFGSFINPLNLPYAGAEIFQY